MSSEQPRKLEFIWEGALTDLKDQYSSVELQHKAMDWRLEFDELIAQARKAARESGLKKSDIEEAIAEVRAAKKRS